MTAPDVPSLPRSESKPAARPAPPVAVVTGASRGIGAAVAHLLAADGAHVVVSSRDAAACEATAGTIRARGGMATAIACHAGSTEAIGELARRIGSEFGRWDILVNNAATNPYFGPIYDTPLVAFEKTVAVNLRGYFMLTCEAVRQMRGHGGVIVNVASIGGLEPQPGQGVYSITKAGILSMTRSFAKDCAPHGIRVNAVAPGFTDTSFSAALSSDPDTLGNYLARIPLGRMARPQEIAAAIRYLCSDAASYVTGTCLTVDGGMLA